MMENHRKTGNTLDVYAFFAGREIGRGPGKEWIGAVATSKLWWDKAEVIAVVDPKSRMVVGQAFEGKMQQLKEPRPFAAYLREEDLELVEPGAPAELPSNTQSFRPAMTKRRGGNETPIEPPQQVQPSIQPQSFGTSAVAYQEEHMAAVAKVQNSNPENQTGFDFEWLMNIYLPLKSDGVKFNFDMEGASGKILRKLYQAGFRSEEVVAILRTTQK